MYELIQVSESCWYIESPVKVGVVGTAPGHVVLIDSGNDRDMAKKIKRILDEKGWALDAVYNTHYHADHTGGNRYLQMNTGCRIYAPEIECEFTRHPFLEPSFLYAGMPPEELKHKFMMAKESDAQVLRPDMLPENIEMIPLPGHSFNMAGYRTSDGVFYIADTLSSKETLEKYQISFLVDPEAYIQTLKKIMDIEAEVYIPCHAPVLDREGLKELAEINIDKVYEVAERILVIISSPKTVDEMLKEIFEGYGIRMTFEQNALTGTTVRSYLSWLEKEGKAVPLIEGNMMKWMRA